MGKASTATLVRTMIGDGSARQPQSRLLQGSAVLVGHTSILLKNAEALKMTERRLETGAPNDRVGWCRAPVLPHHRILSDRCKRPDRLQTPLVPSLLHGRHHHDIAETADESAVIAEHPGIGSFKEYPSIHIVRQEHRKLWRHPCELCDLGHFGCNLRAGIPAADDDDGLADEVGSRAIVGGMELNAFE